MLLSRLPPLRSRPYRRGVPRLLAVLRLAEFLCRFHPRPDDQSRPGALYGQADGREDDRDRGKPPGADLTPRCDHEPDPGGTRGRGVTASMSLGSWSAMSALGQKQTCAAHKPMSA